MFSTNAIAPSVLLRIVAAGALADVPHTMGGQAELVLAVAPHAEGLVEKLRTEDRNINVWFLCHSGGRRDPVVSMSYWIPAFAGMTNQFCFEHIKSFFNKPGGVD